MSLENAPIEDLERGLAEANARKRELERILERRRHTYSTIDGIEEAIGLCASILADEQLASRLREQKFDRLREVLRKVRESPTAYRDDGAKSFESLGTILDDLERWREEGRR